LFINPDTAFILGENLVDYAQRKQYPKAEARPCNIQGISFAIRGNYPKTLTYFQRSLEIIEKIGDKVGIAGSMSNIGGVYYNQGDFSKALIYFQRGIKIFEELGDRKSLATVSVNIGNIYSIQKKYRKAIENYKLSLLTQKELIS
jgi:adenylate cyclase